MSTVNTYDDPVLTYDNIEMTYDGIGIPVSVKHKRTWIDSRNYLGISNWKPTG